MNDSPRAGGDRHAHCVIDIQRGAELEVTLSMASRMVLVLEDDHQLSESVRRLAERLGYRVVAARSLGEAKRLLARIARPCLVLLDTLMKEGIEAMTQLGSQYPLATIPVRLSASNVRRFSKRSVHLDLLREALEQHCGPSTGDAADQPLTPSTS